MKTLMRSVAAGLPMILLCAIRARCQGIDEPLTLVQTIALPGVRDGDFDHFHLDAPGERLFLAAEDNGAVEVIDLRTNKLVHTITGRNQPHSMAYNPDSKKLFIVDEDRVDIYDGTSLNLLGKIPMQAHADASVYAPSAKLFYVGNGGKDAHEDYCLLSIIDTTSGDKVGDIKIDVDHIEAMAIEKSGPRLFANLTSTSAVGVIDREKRTVIATWPNADEGRVNGPMAFDEANHRLFVASRDPNKLIVIDTDSGKVVATRRTRVYLFLTMRSTTRPPSAFTLNVRHS